MQQETHCPKLVPIEVARSVLSALSYSSSMTPQEVHIGRLQSQFSRAGIASELKSALKDLTWLREAEELEQGYWVASPSRTIKLTGEVSLLISALPTRELSRHFTSVSCAGTARIVKSHVATTLPSQLLNSWLGIEEVNTKRWAESHLTLDATEFRAVTSEANMQVFSVSIKHDHGRALRSPLWLPWRDRRALCVNGVGLYRDQAGRNNRFFLGKARNASTFLEGPYAVDVRRLQYGIANIIGKPLQVAVIKRSDTVHIQLPLSAPPFLYRLLMAICTQDISGVWTCRNLACWPTILSSLNSLGCEVVTYE